MNGGPASLKARLANGESAVGLLLAYNAPWLIEIAALAGCQYIVIDLEHEAIGDDAVVGLIRAADAVGVPLLVRVALGGRIVPLLSAGAAGVQIPHLEGPQHAEEVVAQTRFRPSGHRSYYTQSRGAHYGIGINDRRWINDANEKLLVIALLEDVRVLQRLDDVLAVDGIDGFHIGTGDLADSMHHPSAEEFEDAVSEVILRCRAAGKFVGVGVVSPSNAETIPRRLEQGAQLFTVSSTSLLTAAVTGFFHDVTAALQPLNQVSQTPT